MILDDVKQVVTESEVGERVRSDAFKSHVTDWLTTLNPLSSSHQALIYLGAMLYGTNRVTGVHRFGRWSDAISNSVALVGMGADTITNLVMDSISGTAAGAVMKEILTQANALADELKNPNIEGIPIHADSEQENTDVKVSETLVISQLSYNKEYAVDNAAPQLRRWNIKGYLMSNGRDSALNAGLVIKADLLAQRELLQLYADMRKPVMFKTHDNRFFKVLITHLETAYTPQALNALGVNVSLIEFRTLSINESSHTQRMAKTEEVKE